MLIPLNTRLRRKLLAYSFTHCEENYYVRELAGIIGEDPGNLSRELRRMEEDGLYTSSIRGKAKFYSLNRNYPLFDELKQIVFKTAGVEGSLKDIILKYKGISLAFIYGSYAKNKEKKYSDIDLAVVGKFDRDKFTDDIRNLESRLNREINFTVYGEEEFKKAAKEKGSFLNLVIKEKVIILKGRINAG